MATNEFINQISKIVMSLCDEFGFGVPSAIIAQACLESGYGTSNKAKYHNYFGLKYRKNRCISSSGYFEDKSKEENKDGSYTEISTKWFKFDSMEKGIRGYFEFISTGEYNTKAITPEEYLTNLQKGGYCSYSDYIDSCMSIITRYGLKKYDPTYVYTKRKVAMKERPSVLCKSIATIPKKGMIRILKKGRWTKCKYKDIVGYIHGGI